MRVAIVTAGGAGMFCGSCMLDNAWAKGLRQAGVDATLMPLYTPIRVDGENLTSTPIFYGGINVYLNQHVPGWRHLPTFLTRWLNAPRILNWATKHGVSNDARELGEMTVAILRGHSGPQAREGDELLRFLTRELKPDLIVFSNVMLCAEVARLKSEFRGPVLCLLQGDDIFLDGLLEPWKSEVFELLRPIANSLDGFVTHSRFYADFMSVYLGVPVEKMRQLPMAIDCRGHDGEPRPRHDVAVIGYFARLAPEKGLMELVQGALELNRRRQDFRVVAGGYLPPQHQGYVDAVMKAAAPLGERFQYVGSPDQLPEKVSLLKTFDVLSVPAPYREPKGLYILEAWANGVPVVQPAHGHFPELIEESGGGLAVAPGSASALADGLEQLLADESSRFQKARSGWTHVRERHELAAVADSSKRLFAQFLNV